MSGVVKFVAGVALMVVGGLTGNVALIKGGYYLAAAGLLEEASKLFMPKPPKTSVKQDMEYSGTVTPRRIIYGKLRVGGLNVLRPVCWPPNTGNQLGQVIALCGHRVNAIPSVWFDQNEITNAQITAVTGTANDGLVTAGFYAPGEHPVAWVRRYLGTESQTADYILRTNVPDLWTANHRGRGVAYLAVTFRLNEKKFPSGKPEVNALVEGKLCYDPRLDTSPGANPTSDTYKAFTYNPALQLADYLVDPYLGRGVSAAKIDWSLVVAAANICDETVSIPGGTQKRYTSSMMLDAAGNRHEDNIKALASAMMGVCYRQGGKWRMYAGHALSPSFALTEADIMGDTNVRLETPTGERYNFVRGTFTDAARNYQEVEFEPRGNAAYEAADGLRIPTNASFIPASTNYEAQRNALIVLRRGRMRQTLKANFSLAAFSIRPFMVGTMSFADLGWVNKRVVCTSWQFTGNGTIEVTLQEDSASIWATPTVDEYTTPGEAGSWTDAEYTPDPPTNFAGKRVTDGVLFTWTLPTMLAGDTIELLEYTSATPVSSATRIWQGVATSVVIPKADTTTRYYWVRTRAANGNVSTTDPATSGVSSGASATSGTLNASASLSSVTASGTGTTVTTASVTVTPTGGTAGYTHAWTKVSGGTITATSASAASTTFSATSLAASETRTAIFRDTVTDSAAATVTVDVVVTISRTASGGLTVSASSTDIYKLTTTSTATTGSVTVTPSGGTAAYTHAWTKVSGGSITITSPTSATTTFSASGLTVGGSRVATFRDTVTDSASLTASVDVVVTIDRESTA